RGCLLQEMKLQTDALLFSVEPHRSAERLDVGTVHRVVKQLQSQRVCLPTVRICSGTLVRRTCTTTAHLAGNRSDAWVGTDRKITVYTRVSVGRMMQTYNKAYPRAH